MHRRSGWGVEEADLSLERWQLAGEREQGRRLARAVRADERDHLARVDTQVEIADTGMLP